jgi:dihydroorotase
MELSLEGRALIGDQLVACCIGIQDGKIVEIKKMLEGEEHLDFKDMMILPAGVDVHVHFREPGMTSREDFATGTRAAAHGGVTCVMDMPNTIPPTVDRESLENKMEMVRSKAWVDYGLFMGCVPGSDPSVDVKGAIGHKLYMGSTTGDLLVSEDHDIQRILDGVRETGKILSVHAED